MAKALIAIRIPNDLLELIDAEGKRSQVILGILKEHYAPPVIPSEVAKPLPATGDEQSSHAEAVDEAITESPVNVSLGDAVIQANSLWNAFLESPQQIQRAHDPKTCRTYKCGLCVAAKA